MGICPVISPEQAAAPPVEAKPFEQEKVGRSERIHVASPAGLTIDTSRILRHFGKIRKILSPIRCLPEPVDHPDRVVNAREPGGSI
jgi:hypothetical protein